MSSFFQRQFVLTLVFPLSFFLTSSAQKKYNCEWISIPKVCSNPNRVNESFENFSSIRLLILSKKAIKGLQF